MDKKISELPAATVPLAGTEKFEILQGGVNKQVDASDVGGGGSVTSVTGTSVDNTDTANPVVNAVPTTLAANTDITLSADVWLRILGIAGTTPRLIIDGVNNTRRSIQFRTGNLQRWDIHVENDETGSNAGSNLHIERYNDAGSFIDAPFQFNRATGVLALSIGPTVPTAAPGTNTTQAASTAFVQTAVSQAKSFVVAVTDEVTNIGTGAGKVSFRMPYAMTLTAVRASLVTAQASGTIFTVDINEAGVSILSTKLTIDNTETTSVSAATPAVISDTALADDAVITVDVDQIGDGTAIGLKITLIGT